MAARRPPRWREPRALLLDANILLVLVVGRYSEDALESFKRTSHYDRQDFQRVDTRCRRFEKSRSLLTTPHILTEVSNLLNQLGDPAGEECRRKLASLVSVLDERFTPARDLATLPAFTRFGIADAAIVQFATTDVAVFTDDFALGGSLEKEGLTVWNLRKMRSHEPSGSDL